ncbi:MAG: DUF262 domain-containing protein [Methanobacteriota archaeon]|nr:MAG: DUF262 domain-containing protein [Euryarchaeota archaeon]
MYSIKSKKDLIEKVRKNIGTIRLSNEFCSDVMAKSLKIPEFQRYFEWDESNVNRLLDDIFQLTRGNRPTVEKIIYNEETKFSFETQFMGAIIVQSNSKNYVIDGQQRLTSLLMVYSVIDNIYNYLLNEVPLTLAERNPKLKLNLDSLLRVYRDEDQEFLPIDEVEDSLFRLDIASSSQHRKAIRDLTNRIFRNQSLIEFRKIENRIVELRTRLRFLANQEKNDYFDNQKKKEMNEILIELYQRLTNDLEPPSPSKLRSMKKQRLKASTKLQVFPDPYLWMVYIFDLVLEKSGERLSTHLKRLLETFILIYQRMVSFLGDLAKRDISIDLFSLTEEERKSLVEDLLQALLTVLFSVSYSLWFAFFEVPENLNVFEIFETINSTGKNLSQSDLIKYALISYSSNEQKSAVEDRWDALVLKVEKINENKVSKLGFENLVYYHFLTRFPEAYKQKQPKSRFGRVLIEEFDKKKIPRNQNDRDRWIMKYLDELENIVSVFSYLFVEQNEKIMLSYDGIKKLYSLEENVLEPLYAITYFLKYENIYPLLFKIINSIYPDSWFDFLWEVEKILVHNAVPKLLSATQILNVSIEWIKNSVWDDDSKNYDAFLETIDYLEEHEFVTLNTKSNFISAYKHTKMKKETAYYFLRKIEYPEIVEKHLKERFPLQTLGEVELIFIRKGSSWSNFSNLPEPEGEILEKMLGNYIILAYPMIPKIRNGTFEAKKYHLSNEPLKFNSALAKINEWTPECIESRTETLASKLYEIYQ